MVNMDKHEHRRYLCRALLLTPCGFQTNIRLSSHCTTRSIRWQMSKKTDKFILVFRVVNKLKFDEHLCLKLIKSRAIYKYLRLTHDTSFYHLDMRTAVTWCFHFNHLIVTALFFVCILGNK